MVSSSGDDFLVRDGALPNIPNSSFDHFVLVDRRLLIWYNIFVNILSVYHKY